MSTFTRTPAPSYSPWGAVDERREIAPGMWLVTTPSHGGILLSPERVAAMPEVLKSYVPFAHRGKFPTEGSPRWYEEDCDWAIVALAFPEEIRAYNPEADLVAAACATVQCPWSKHLSQDIRDFATALAASKEAA